MQITEQIHTTVQKLPEPFQIEALDFVEYLLMKSERTIAQQAMQNESGWSAFSLNAAMRGMENEETPAYGVEDLKVTFA